MSAEWVSPRAKAEQAVQAKRQAFEELMTLVDTGELELATVMAMSQELGAIALLGSIPVNPAIQATGIRKLERSIDEARDE